MIGQIDIYQVLVTSVGTLILILIRQVLATIKELKEEIKILSHLDSRLTAVEEFKQHFKGCTNFKR